MIEGIICDKAAHHWLIIPEADREANAWARRAQRKKKGNIDYTKEIKAPGRNTKKGIVLYV